MNKKGIGLIFSIATVLVFFMAGMLILNHLKIDLALVTSNQQLDCNNVEIADGIKIMCLGIDFIIPALIFTILGLIGAVTVGSLRK